jgi:hypothetical protein
MGYFYQKAVLMKEGYISRMVQNTSGDSHVVIGSDCSYDEAWAIFLGNILHSTHPIVPHRSDGGDILSISTPVKEEKKTK